jgi:hypothetical protein
MPQETLPGWLTGVSTTERLARERYEAITEEHRRITQELENARTAFEEAANWKRLLHETGDDLRQQVAKALELFGFSVSSAPEAEDYLVAATGGTAVVVVSKGVEESASEIHAMQLEKSVSDFGLMQGRLPKGLLVISSFRNTPLDERTNPTFSAQLLEYSTQRKHALLTGVQLFGMVSEVLQDPRKAAQIRELLVNTVGPVKGYANPSEFLAPA